MEINKQQCDENKEELTVQDELGEWMNSDFSGETEAVEDWGKFLDEITADLTEKPVEEKKEETPAVPEEKPEQPVQAPAEEKTAADFGKEKSKTEIGKKLPLLIALGAVVILAAVAIWFFCTHVIVDWKVYSKQEDILDLRGEEITPEHYDAIREKLPDCLIYWNVPFRDGLYSNDSEELTITGLTDADIARLVYFPQLKTIHAEECEEYDQLVKLQNAHPDYSVLYTVAIDGTEYSQNAVKLTVAGLTDAEVALTDYLPLLETVDAEECTDYAQLVALQARRPECAVNYSVKLGEQKFALDTKTLELTNQNLSELLERLAYLPAMEKIHLVDPLGDAATMETLIKTYPNVAITSELVGVSVSEDGKEVDLSAVTLAKVEDVDKYMAFYPDAERVYLGMPEFDNETIAAFRESKRQDYKVVWTVMCGKLKVRTDRTWFHPVQEYVFYFFDEDAYNLRYCEDMICVDVGHMALKDISWVEYMPNLKYLILCMTTVLDISSLSTCKNLIYLEIDWTGIKDYTPLLGCTSLQDIKMDGTFGDENIIAQMTWLKNIWWNRGYAVISKLQEALPEATICRTERGWRKLPNYYAMRDVLGAPYMPDA